MERTLPIEFFKGVPTTEDIENFAHVERQRLIVLDDLMCESSGSDTIQNAFTRQSHHLGVTILYLLQNIFCQGKASRTIALNTHYQVLMKNSRIQQINTLGSQLGIGKALMESYLDSMKTKYGYLVLDQSPHREDEHMMKTHIFEGEDMIVYDPI
jgi:hypothetical protein